MRGEAAVHRAVGPAVLTERNIFRAGGNNRLDGDDQAFGQFVLRGEIREIGHRRRLVNGSPDAMPTELAHHVKTAPVQFALHRAADVLRAISRPAPLRCSPRNPCGSRLFGGQVEFDEITALNHAIPGNPVHHFVVDADAHVAREPVHHRRRRPRPMCRKHARAKLAKLGSRNTGAHFRNHRAQRLPHDYSARTQPLKLFRAVNRHAKLCSLQA
jgi:hypothetical protein